ncbi:MAG: Fe-S biogenesis protein NfuA [Gammaproteobacteria bacterium]|nr:Fe-S biogenesis protein NfuA [Gammaproteobacteria bacterium]MBQ0838782.1 Fe-S biogenesis protein NfuA [Gammaproteobacteria bacterium]
MSSIEITESAQEYLAGLLAKQDCEGIAIRLFVADPGTPKAETCIAYCKPGEEQEEDQILELPGLKAYLDKRSIPFLEDAKVDYSPDRLGGQLSIRAPNSRMPRVTDDSPIEDKVNYILHSEINPGLAAHGGNISLEEMDGDIAVLQFGGGCQGCGQADVTMKDGVERTLLEKIPELKGVRDMTDHSDSSQAYYK